MYVFRELKLGTIVFADTLGVTRSAVFATVLISLALSFWMWFRFSGLWTAPSTVDINLLNAVPVHIYL